MRLVLPTRYVNRLGVDKGAMRAWDRELQAVGGVKLFFVKINNTAELFSVALLLAAGAAAVAALGTALGTFSVMNFSFIAVGLTVMFYLSWRNPVEAHKELFMKDDELPVAVEMFIAGLEAGISIENIVAQAAKNLDGAMGRSLAKAQDDLDAKKPLKDALMEAAENSLNSYYKRFALILTQGRETGSATVKQYLEEFLDEIEEVRQNRRIERAATLDTKLFFPIFIGYFLPILVLFSLPFLLSIRDLFKIF